MTPRKMIDLCETHPRARARCHQPRHRSEPKPLKMERNHKNLVHLSLLAAIALCFTLGIDAYANWLFVALGVMVEVGA
jgi:hypothetical protein